MKRSLANRAKENRLVRRESLREELKSREYLRQVHNLVSTDLETFKEYHGPIKTKIETYLALLRKTLPDLKALEMSGPEGTPISVHSMTDADLANRLIKHLQEQHTLEGTSTDITPATPTSAITETLNTPKVQPEGVPDSTAQQGIEEERAYPGTEEGSPSALHPPIQNSPPVQKSFSEEEPSVREMRLSEGAEARETIVGNSVDTALLGEVNQVVEKSHNTEIANRETIGVNGSDLPAKPSKTKVKKSEKLKNLEDML